MKKIDNERANELLDKIVGWVEEHQHDFKEAAYRAAGITKEELKMLGVEDTDYDISDKYDPYSEYYANNSEAELFKNSIS